MGYTICCSGGSDRTKVSTEFSQFQMTLVSCCGVEFMLKFALPSGKVPTGTCHSG